MAVHLHSRLASYHSSASMEADETSDSSRSSRSASASPSDEVPPPPVTKYSPPTSEGFTIRKGKDYRPPSTFYLKDPRKEMTASERLCYLATCPAEIHLVKDDRIDRGPMPTQSIFMENVFILSRALPPILIQAISHWVFPNFKWPSYLAYPLYYVSFVLFALSVIWRLNYYCVKYGTLDEHNVGRDRTPDKSVARLAKGVIIYMFLRTALPFFWYYDKNVNPLTSFSWTFPIRMGLWQLSLDYFFYAYHRSCHEVDWLWFVHMEHHTTKHPTAILSILAGDYQECLEIALIPIAATVLIPMSFSELYVTLCYTLYVEMLGHSGVRAYWTHPVLWVLRAIDCELAVEDHDLHHRHGKSGKNYGKQSRVWDKLFGTVGERDETKGM